jgi:hypothetical protein
MSQIYSSTGPLSLWGHSTKASAAPSTRLQYIILTSTSSRDMVANACQRSPFKVMIPNVTFRRLPRLSWKKRDRPAPDRGGGGSETSHPTMPTSCSSLVAKRRTRKSQVTVVAAAGVYGTALRTPAHTSWTHRWVGSRRVFSMSERINS